MASPTTGPFTSWPAPAIDPPKRKNSDGQNSTAKKIKSTYSDIINAVMDTILLNGGRPELRLESQAFPIETVVQGSNHGSGLQKWLVDALMPDLNVRLLESLEGKLPASFLMELLKRRVEGKTISGCATYANRCKYHEHPNGEERCA
ncbi:hypothetical protein LTR85_010950 [Meristemomyces frigidus]|nr:hypothetical protein LTR85_010950 [Meristemomyces frigidus]